MGIPAIPDVIAAALPAGLDGWSLLLLAAFGLLAGIGITAVGPGGVLATIGLFAFSGLSPHAVAGTGIATHVATGLAGTAAYSRSGQLREPATRRIALTLACAAVVGTPLGIMVNSKVSAHAFGILLAAFVALVGVMVWHRERGAARRPEPTHPHHPTVVLAAIGLGVAAVSGLFGVGGPLLTVPLLVTIGTPVLSGLAAAQVQSVLIATVGALGYFLQGAICWPLAAIVGVPELAGVFIGWRIAHAVPTRMLRYTLVAVLLALAPYLALRS